MKNMNIKKVLEILENGDFENIKEKTKTEALTKSTYYDITLKEGGGIRLEQFGHMFSRHFKYTIYLFVPIEDMSIESWTIEYKKRPALYKRVKDIFYKLHYDIIKERDEKYSKYFPQ